MDATLPSELPTAVRVRLKQAVAKTSIYDVTIVFTLEGRGIHESITQFVASIGATQWLLEIEIKIYLCNRVIAHVARID